MVEALRTEWRQTKNKFLSQVRKMKHPVGKLNWGDLRRGEPFCNEFGFERGTPIDRYYLDKFIGSIRHQVKGKVVEIGGALSNRGEYGFENVSTYDAVDLLESPLVNICGDVHESNLLKPGYYDTILLFNVLEHCHTPQKVVDNIQNWLVPSGYCMAIVPNAQRIHNNPGDYWRILPDGMKTLFQNFDEVQVTTYGNPTSLIASYMGIAAEELTPDELDQSHPLYPVTTCLVAKNSNN
ncbi:MAG: class I SAM-dependent methyltransferase [Scytonematopsis contorta HA4267-MV1]|jgi:SAM-dependent methyltransferase|nr:class I SAM-dependent methyltransferase [Scytonematopsis contorta HA4267-MV1]